MVFPSEIRVVSSMATRPLLADLAGRFEATSPLRVSVESVGGVDAAKRVMAGEAFDVVVLAAEVIDELIAAGRIVPGSRFDLAKSAVAIAARTGAAHPDIGSADAVKQAVLAARSIGYSSGPSGTHLAKLFERWGIADVLKSRIVVAPPGVPVGRLVARGDVELGFQQLSELITVNGIDVVGLLPPAIQVMTTFSGGVARSSTQPDAARALLEFLSGPMVAEIRQRHGMEG
jgi:molybdate transport system substrate-binding protein